MKYTIDYGFGTARLYTPSENWENRFNDLASQCFGIRKSISQVILIRQEDVEPECKLDGESERLEHSGGDVIVWDSQGNKIKSEFDGV